MGQPAEKRPRATYADLEAVPPGKVAELIDGELYVFPRPAPRHARAASRLLGKRAVDLRARALRSQSVLASVIAVAWQLLKRKARTGGPRVC